MPKIIEDLNNKIIEAAEEIFLNNDYDDVEMKTIAKEVGIAVGTLYNYFPNKLILFLKTYERFTIKQYEKIREVLELNISEKEKIYKLFIQIYDNSKNYRNINFFTIYKNLDKQLNYHKKVKDYIKEISDKYYFEIKQIFTNIITNLFPNRELDDDYFDRLIPMFLMGIRYMSFDFEKEEQKNLDFIVNFIDEVIINGANINSISK